MEHLKCKGKRDGISGCRKCCANVKDYNTCINCCMYDNCNIIENHGAFSISAAVWGGGFPCDPDDPNMMGVC